ncbi:MAG TPA: TlpA disulfide reductase family protein [Terracidiphilus sp.]|jgi:peroxiredoxin|nr:TlpA disulfide reductase family protein [Terracidiphilus sp.]
MREARWLVVIVALLTMSAPFRLHAQDSTQDFVQKVTQAGRSEHSLSADIELTWKTSTRLKKSTGTVRLMKPNYALIKLAGDYPLHVLISDGTVRYLAPDDKSYTQESMDPRGEKIDTPWWGFPYRFFFTQSLNPFGAAADPTEHLDTVSSKSIDGQLFRVLQVHGTGPMGEYRAEFLFGKDVLERTIVQFGAGIKTGVFEARLSNIRLNAPYTVRSFRFVPAAGQKPTSISGGMLSIGDKAPDFTLPTPEGKQLTLSIQRQGKKATLVNFWYYNCAPCRIEFPEFEKLYEQYRGQGFTIVAVNRGDSAKTVADYARRTGLVFPTVLGGDLGKPGVFANYKITEAFPQTYLLDADGRVVYRTAGMDIEGLKRALQQLGFR